MSNSGLVQQLAAAAAKEVGGWPALLQAALACVAELRGATAQQDPIVHAFRLKFAGAKLPAADVANPSEHTKAVLSLMHAVALLGAAELPLAANAEQRRAVDFYLAVRLLGSQRRFQELVQTDLWHRVLDAC